MTPNPHAEESRQILVQAFRSSVQGESGNRIVQLCERLFAGDALTPEDWWQLRGWNLMRGMHTRVAMTDAERREISERFRRAEETLACPCCGSKLNREERGVYLTLDYVCNAPDGCAYRFSP